VEKIECQTCGWTGNEGDLETPWSAIEPSCPECMGGNFLDIENDPIITKMGKLVESINRETEKIKRIDKKYEHLPENKRNTG